MGCQNFKSHQIWVGKLNSGVQNAFPITQSFLKKAGKMWGNQGGEILFHGPKLMTFDTLYMDKVFF